MIIHHRHGSFDPKRLQSIKNLLGYGAINPHAPE